MKEILKGKRTSAKELLDYLKSNCEEFQYKAPIDLEKIVQCLNIHVEYIDDEESDILGEIKVENNEPKIIINLSNHMFDERIRFTLAHELGHLCKHIAPNDSTEFKDTAKTMKRDKSWSIYEYEANNFAARLLMPQDLLMSEIKKLINEIKRSNETISQDEFVARLANKFQVSKSAMMFRLKNLGILK